MSLDPFTAGFDLVKTGLDKIFPDANVEMKGKIDAAAAAISNEFILQSGQIETNKIEAANASWFVAGWRPFVGWVCGFALSYAAIIEPIARFIASVAFGYLGVFPVINTEITMQILLGLLGLGGMRTFEKYHGKTK